MTEPNAATRRVELLRARRAQKGLTRIDLYVHTEDHEKVKRFVNSLNEKRFGIITKIHSPQEKPKETIEDKLARQAEEARAKFKALL
jgi:hypothetical protein